MMYPGFRALNITEILQHFYAMCVNDAKYFSQHPEVRKFRAFVNMFDKSPYPYYQNVFSQRHFPVVEEILSLNPPYRTLDCGCGMGYDAILFGLLGSDVIAVDVHEPSIYIALELSRLYSQRYPKLNLSIKHRDIFSFLEENEADLGHYFDIIWLTEAISHIHPLERFLRMIRRFVSSRGCIIISESNVLNPLVRLGVSKDRIQRYHKRGLRPQDYRTGDFCLFPESYKDMATGESVLQANERMLSPFRLIDMLRNNGFSNFRLYFKTFLPKFVTKCLDVQVIRSVESAIEAVPLLRRFGIRYVVFAR